MDSAGIAIERLSFRYPDYPGFRRARCWRPGPPVAPGEIAAAARRLGRGQDHAGAHPRRTGAPFLGRRLGGMVVAAAPTRCGPLPTTCSSRWGSSSSTPTSRSWRTRCDARGRLRPRVARHGAPQPSSRRVRDALALLGLSGFEARNPATLSGGEKKRLLLACLEALDPAGVDPGRGVRGARPVVAAHRCSSGCARRAGPRSCSTRAGRQCSTGGSDRHAVLSHGSVHGLAADPGSPALRAAMDARGDPAAFRACGRAARDRPRTIPALHGPFIRVPG